MGYKLYCKDYENIENYDKAKVDNFVGWDCHHRLETHNSDGVRRLVDISAAELKALDMYYNRPSSELIFIKHGEHKSLHQKGRCLSEEHKKKLSEAKKGKYAGEKNPMYGKKHSEEVRNKISRAHKGKKMSAETRKRMSESRKGHLVSEETRKKLSEAKQNISAETRRKIGETKKGMRWFNNGKINIRAKECHDGFTPGQLRK